MTLTSLIEKSGHLPVFPLSGRLVVLPPTSTQDESVPTTIAPPPRAEMTGNLRPDLERFWPSRRGYAYDEFCR